MAVLTVSRQLGSRGSEIAAGVAERLSLRFVDREIIHRAAQEAGVPQATLMEQSYEGQRSLFERALDIVNTMPGIPQVPHTSRRETTAPMALPLSNILTPAAPIFSQPMASYVRVVEQIIRDLANQGNIVIVGRGGQMILRGRDDTLHVHIIAPFDQRVDTLIQRDNLKRREARARVAASDRARSEYIRRFYHVQWFDPTLYDLVMNTDKIDTLTGIELIVRAQMAVKTNPKS
ncbi:MAG: AAA family ATPase [Anaerolineae bacterium]